MSDNKRKELSINEYGKLPPQDIEFEKSILGCVINHADAYEIVARILKPECFYKVHHQLIFKAICELSDADKPIDNLTITDQIKRNGNLEEIGGPYAIGMLALKTAFNINLEYHCYIVLDLFIKREMISLLQENINLLYDDKTDVLDIYNAIHERLEEIFGNLDEQMVHHIDSTVNRAIKEIESYQSGEVTSVLKCGDRIFDEVIYTSPEQIIGIAASRGAGKTRYLIKLIRGFFEYNKNDIAVLWYSMEDSDTKIVRAFASTATGLSDSQMQSKGYTLSDKELHAVTHEIKRFSDLNIDIINEQDSIAAISRRFTRFIKKNEEKVCFLCIDNIMLIEDLYNSTDSNQTKIEDTVAAKIRGIMNKAKKSGHRVVIIFLHHMTKEMESRMNAEEGYRPKLSHMKGTTRFADICSAVVLVNNPGMHKDLLRKHAALPDILCVNSDGSTHYVPRKRLLEHMMIAEVAKNRDGEMNDDTKAVVRYVVDFSIMKFVELKTLRG